MTLRLSRQTREKLTQRAAASGRDVESYTSELVEQAVNRPTLEDLLKPIQEDFVNSGLTEDEIMNLGRSELDRVRQDRKANKA